MRRAIPSRTVVEPNERHRQGLSCITTPAVKYDANGWKRWCVDCDAQLGPVGDDGALEWVEGGLEVPEWAVLTFVVVWVTVVLMAVFLAFGPEMAQAPVDPSNLPSTYGPPAATIGG